MAEYNLFFKKKKKKKKTKVKKKKKKNVYKITVLKFETFSFLHSALVFEKERTRIREELPNFPGCQSQVLFKFKLENRAQFCFETKKK